MSHLSQLALPDPPSPLSCVRPAASFFCQRGIADKGGIPPLVHLLTAESAAPGAQQQACAALAELALIPSIRDQVAGADAIRHCIRLLATPIVGTPEIAARVLEHLARGGETDAPVVAAPSPSVSTKDANAMRSPSEDAVSGGSGSSEGRHGSDDHGFGGSEARREAIRALDGLGVLISMIDHGSPQTVRVESTGLPIENPSIGMIEQAASTLAQIAFDSSAMQDAIIAAGGIRSLLTLVKTGSQVAQEHAARAVRNLASEVGNQRAIVDCGGIPDLVHLTKTGSVKAQELAAAGLSELASGAVSASANRGGSGVPSKQRGPDQLALIAEAGGIVPLVTMTSSTNSRGRENAARALMHLALHPANRIAISQAHGIAPLVSILDDGTPLAQQHAADAIAQLAKDNEDNQMQSCKHLVGLITNGVDGAQRRGARVIAELAKHNPGSPVIIVNAGAISPLATLLSTGSKEVKEEASAALSNLSLNSPSTQFAIATALVGLIGVGSADGQEHVTGLLLTLASDSNNLVAIARAGAIAPLVTQLRGLGQTSTKAQELAAAVLSHLSRASAANADAIANASAIKPLVMLLPKPADAALNAALSAAPPAEVAHAEAHAAMVLADLANRSTRNKTAMLLGIPPLVALLSKDMFPMKARAEAAGALRSLATGQPETQRLVAEAGGIRALVTLLNEDDGYACKKAAGAIGALCSGCVANQDYVNKSNGIVRLIELLGPKLSGDEVRAEAAGTLAILTRSNKTNQDKMAQEGGIAPLVALLQEGTAEEVECTAAALWSLVGGGADYDNHFENQVAIADAGGIKPLVAVLGLNAQVQEQAGGALAALALNNEQNVASIAKLIVSLLGSADGSVASKAARAISRLAQAGSTNQVAISKAGGVELLVVLLDKAGIFDSSGSLSLSAETPENKSSETESSRGVGQGESEGAYRQVMASAIWYLARNNVENQVAVATAGGISRLIALLHTGTPECRREVAGALWSLAGNPGNMANQAAIAASGGIEPLVELLGTPQMHTQEEQGEQHDAKETAAGALHALAEYADNRVLIAKNGGIPRLVALLAEGTEKCREQAAGALQSLVLDNPHNQQQVAQGLAAMLRSGSATERAQEVVTELLRDLANDTTDNCSALARAGAVPELVKQLECGSPNSMGMAAQGLALIALKLTEQRTAITQELVKLLASVNEAVRQRASEALRDMAAEQRPGEKSVTASGAQQTTGLVNLLKDGLKDSRVEAQEYALWSLSGITDAASREVIAASGGIQPLITALQGRKLSDTAQEHAVSVLSRLAPIGHNAKAIEEAMGIDPLVQLLSEGNVNAKEHAALALAQLARRASAGRKISEAGGVAAFVAWLHEKVPGPAELAAHALAEIALDDGDMQVQIAEAGACMPLIAMVRAWSTVAAEADAGGSASKSTQSVASALKLATVAAGTLATLAKDAMVNQIVITEEGGIPPLLELLADKARSSHENVTRALWHLAQTEDNQSFIPRAGGISPLVALLKSDNEATQQHTAAALYALARDDIENQISLAKAGAIEPLVNLLGSDSKETQEHSVGVLLSLASHDDASRTAVVKRLVAVLDARNAAAQMKAAEALAVLATRSAENRRAITTANAIVPLVRLLGDGRNVRAQTPQERAAAVLSDLAKDQWLTQCMHSYVHASDALIADVRLALCVLQAKMAENKLAIVAHGGVRPLVAMLSSDSLKAQTNAAGALCQMAAIANSKTAIAEANGIVPLVTLLATDSVEAQKWSTGALWHLASSADNKTAMVNAGAIPSLVALVDSSSPEACENATAVLSELARTQGGTKKAIVQAGGIEPLIQLLTDASVQTQRHAACALWGLADGKEGVYDKQIVEQGALRPLIAMLMLNHPDTRGFAAACLSCCCADDGARKAIRDANGAAPLLALLHSPSGWLRQQAMEMASQRPSNAPP